MTDEKPPVDWRICPRCGETCYLAPLSSLFDATGEKYGALFQCSCGWRDCNRFISPEEIQILKEKENQIKKEGC